MPSFQISTAIKYSILVSLLSIASLQNSFAEEGYPAPPGHYSAPGLFKEIPAETDKEATPAVASKETDQPVLTETIETEPPATQDIAPETIATAITKQLQPVAAAAPITPKASIKAEPVQPIATKTVSTPKAIAPAQSQQTYPNAFALQQSYQQAKSLPFSQWGDMPEQGYQSNNSNDYGSSSVPINATRNRSYPTVMNQPSNYMPYPNMPYPNIPYSKMPRSLNYIPGDRNSMGFNPGNTMNQYGPSFGNLMPPTSTYLKQFNQYPVPQTIYGLAAPTIQRDRRYMQRIPAEEIIYPPSYPGRR